MTAIQNAAIGGILMTAVVLALTFMTYKVIRKRVYGWLSSPAVVQKDDGGGEEEEEILGHPDVLLDRAEHLASIAIRTAAVLVTITLLTVGIQLVRTSGLADGLAQAVARMSGAG